VAARELANGRFAAESRHHQVHEHRVDDLFVEQLQRFLGGCRLHDRSVGRRLQQQRREAVAEQWMVIDDEQFHDTHLKESRGLLAIPGAWPFP